MISYDAAGTRIRDRESATGRDRFFADDYFILEVDVGANKNDSAELRIFAEGQQIARKIIGFPQLRTEALFVLPWPRIEVRPTGEGVALAISASALLLLLGWVLAAGTAREQPVSALVATAITLALVFPPGIAFGGGGGSSSVRHWFLNDHLGSANAWITEDGFGGMRVVYTPFGKVHQEDGQSPPNRIFAGHPVDDVTGLHYMKARWSNSETGMFLSIDPLVASKTDPQSYNAYAYARNNPIAHVDPEGTSITASKGGVSVGWIDGAPVKKKLTKTAAVVVETKNGSRLVILGNVDETSRGTDLNLVNAANAVGKAAKAASQGSEGAGDPGSAKPAPEAIDPLTQAELKGVAEVQGEMHGAREFSSEVHQRDGGYQNTPVKEGEPHSASFKTAPRTLVTLVHSHTTNAGIGREAGSWDRNVATNVPVNVITVYPNGTVTRIDTRGNVAILRGTRFAPIR